MRMYSDECEEYKSELLVQVARSHIPVVPAGVLGLMELCQQQVLSDVHYSGRSMDEAWCLDTFKKLARVNEGVRNVQRFKGESRKLRACCTCGSGNHVAAKCPSRNAVGKRPEETTEKFEEESAHMSRPQEHGSGFLSGEVRILGQMDWRIARCVLLLKPWRRR